MNVLGWIRVGSGLGSSAVQVEGEDEMGVWMDGREENGD